MGVAGDLDARERIALDVRVRKVSLVITLEALVRAQ
jgi:hypothetical protein